MVKNDQLTLYNKGTNYLKKGEFEEAIKYLKQALKLNSEDVDTIMNLCASYNGLKKFDETLHFVDEAIKREPLDIMTWMNKGFIHLQQGKFDEAISTFNHVREIAPSFNGVWHQLFIARRNKNIVSELNLDKDDYPIDIRNSLREGLNQMNVGKFDKALSICFTILKKNPEMVECLVLIGLIFVQLKNADEMLTYSDKAINLNPNFKLVWNIRGLAYYHLGKFIKSIDCYEKALKIDPNYESAWTNKGLALDTLKKYDLALKCYNRSIELEPHYFGVWMNRGETLRKLGLYKDAKECYLEALRLNPNLHVAKEALDEVNMYLSYDPLKKVFHSVHDARDYCLACGKKNYVFSSHCSYCGKKF